MSEDSLVTMRELQKRCYKTNKSKGWHTLNRRPLEYHALISSEIAEATEEVRKGSDPLYYHRGSKKPEGEAIELADAVIRIMDYFSSRGWDLQTMVEIKDSYNQTREYLHGNKKV